MYLFDKNYYSTMDYMDGVLNHLITDINHFINLVGRMMIHAGILSIIHEFLLPRSIVSNAI